MTRHCENCGQEKPAMHEGYTICCNELVCTGPVKNFYVDWKGYTWGTGEFDKVQVEPVIACCGIKADEAFIARDGKCPPTYHRLD